MQLSCIANLRGKKDICIVNHSCVDPISIPNFIATQPVLLFHGVLFIAVGDGSWSENM
jgi:hypothetical protein